jgi:hypothetical protein
LQTGPVPPVDENIKKEMFNYIKQRHIPKDKRKTISEAAGVHPSMLSTLTQLHPWSFGAMAELIHNSVSESVVWVLRRTKTK